MSNAQEKVVAPASGGLPTGELLVTTSPHIRGPEDIPRVMWTVVGALLPAGLVGVYFFGYYAFFIVVLSVLAAVLTEAVIQKYLLGQPVSVKDGSAVITGILLAYVLPPGVPWYIPVVGAIFAIGIVKHAFGGLGNNIWNPALAARAFLQVAYPAPINSDWRIIKESGSVLSNITGVDAITQASPLFKEFGGKTYSYVDLLTGRVPGCIGETSVIALMLGGAYLIYRGYVDWRVPVGYIGTVFVLAKLLPARIEAPWANDPIYHVLAGGLMLGAFFMATDMVTSPLTRRGLLIFGIGCGVLTTLIRFYAAYPEGVCYSILLMNTATPLIDRFTQPTLLGSASGGKK
ncbi:MAG: RnfABCDGE type electron transport complex subunit D [Candidatus Brocadiaceae bacterium]|nr:RnfABCDGE type electron transport complex subunit D [Candidatus Brocadiaceae bacterium]